MCMQSYGSGKVGEPAYVIFMQAYRGGKGVCRGEFMSSKVYVNVKNRVGRMVSSAETLPVHSYHARLLDYIEIVPILPWCHFRSPSERRS